MLVGPPAIKHTPPHGALLHCAFAYPAFQPKGAGPALASAYGPASRI
jgi:hypothetical protein